MKLIIDSPVEHDGKALEVGTIVDFEDAAGEALVAAGAATAVVEEVKASKAKKTEAPQE